MWGVVAWEKVPGGHDKSNPDASKQNRLTLGMPILLDMKKKGARRRLGRPSLQRQGRKTYDSTIKPVGSDQLEIRGCVLGFLCGGETWTRVAPPIPSSPANSMAKGIKPAAAPAPKMSGSAAAAQKMANAHPNDPVGDICLLPDIARFAH